MKKNGFTLIELLVVISILGILASFVISSMTGAQKQARDSQRKSDLNQYRNALETYAAGNGSLYPAQASAVNLTTVCSASLVNYMAACTLDDPLSTRNYKYLSSAAPATKYVIYSQLETTGYYVLCSTGTVGVGVSVPTTLAGSCP